MKNMNHQKLQEQYKSLDDMTVLDEPAMLYLSPTGWA